MNADEFYRSNNLEKYPDGRVRLCKKCMTMHVDNWNPDSFLWILQEIDIPYIANEWNSLMQSYVNNNKKINSTTIIGRYISKMKLLKWKDFRWKDNEFLAKQAEAQQIQNMKNAGYTAAQIQQVLAEGRVALPDKPVKEPTMPDMSDEALDKFGAIQLPDKPETTIENPDSTQQQFTRDEEESIIGQLTEEDKTYLRLKWGKAYTLTECVQMETLYNDMLKSYDIQAAGDLNTLVLMCKSSLKANQLLDLGDIEGAQKAQRMYDNLMKAGKWTAAQNKTDDNSVVDSVGALVALCEKEGFIPQYYVDGPQDKVDRVIEDMQQYTRELIVDELGLENLIENAVKQMQQEKAAIEAASQSGVSDEDKLFDYDHLDEILKPEDYTAFDEFQQQLQEQDEKIFKEGNK